MLVIVTCPLVQLNGGHEMAKKKKKKAVRIGAVVQRINQKLAANGKLLVKATRWMKLKVDFGDYYMLDLNGNVVDTHIDPEKLARKLRVLHEWEKVKRS